MNCRAVAVLTFYGFITGLFSSLVGVSGGAVSNAVLTLYGQPMQRAVATSAGVGVPITIAGTIGYMLAGWPHMAKLPPLSIGFVSLIGFVLMAPVSSYTASYGVRLAHWLPRRKLEIAFGIFLVLVVAALYRQPDRLTFTQGLPAHAQPVAAHLPAFQPVEEGHAEQIVLELSGLRHQRRHRALGQSADGEAIERHRRRARAAIGGVDIDRIVEHFDRQAGGLGRFLRQHHRACAGVEHHRHARAVDMRGHREVAAMAAHDFDIAAVAGHVARHQFRDHAVGDVAQFEAVAVADHQQQADHRPEQGCFQRLRQPFAEQAPAPGRRQKPPARS